MYFNGLQDAPELVSTEVTSVYDSAEAMIIGVKNNMAHSFPFFGMIDELRISSVARSADWIRAQYKSQNGEFVTLGCEETEASMGCAP